MGKFRMLGMLAAIAVGTVGAAEAQVSVFTPVLSAASLQDQIVCRVTNTDTLGQFVIVQFRGAYDGTPSSTMSFAIGAGQTEEIAGNSAQVYCEAIANTAALADKLVVVLYVRNTNDESIGALSGSRIMTGTGTVLRTGSLEAGGTATIGCHVINVGSAPQTVTTTLLDDAGGVLATQTNSALAVGAGFLVKTGIGPLTARCEVTASSNALAKQLRVSSFEAISGTFFNSHGPLAGSLRQ